MSEYEPSAKQLRWQAEDHRACAERANNPKRARAHLEIAVALEAEADAIERDAEGEGRRAA